MSKRKFTLHVLCLVVSILLGLFCLRSTAGESDPSWMNLSQLTLSAPLSLIEREYLGVKGQGNFALSEIPAKIILVECLNLYCPSCDRQAAVANRLHELIQKDSDLSRDVKVMGICAGNNQKEVEVFKENLLISFPLFADPDFIVHNKFGSPRTPFTIALDANGKVLFFRYGIVKDVDAFFCKIKQFYQQHCHQYTRK